MASRKSVALVRSRITNTIVMVRQQRVILDSALAGLYGVETRTLVQAVKRNRARFPVDFMFQLTTTEIRNLRSQIVISSEWGGRRTKPYAFTEQGVAMLSSVLRSDRAVDVNVEIMRAFVRFREVIAGHAALARRLDELESSCDRRFRSVFAAIRQIVAEESRPRRRIGFQIAAPSGTGTSRITRAPRLRK